VVICKAEANRKGPEISAYHRAKADENNLVATAVGKKWADTIIHKTTADDEIGADVEIHKVTADHEVGADATTREMKADHEMGAEAIVHPLTTQVPQSGLRGPNRQSMKVATGKLGLEQILIPVTNRPHSRQFQKRIASTKM
jgi:hypothetical protein